MSSIHVDWITTTTNGKEASDRLWSVGNALLTSDEAEGEAATAWHRHGYRGYRTGGVELGARADGGYLRLSSQKAAQNWFEAGTAAENCTRLDLAIDVHFDPPMATLGQQLYRQIPHRNEHAGRPPGKRLVVDTNGGCTVYLGSRSSSRMGRVYDKGVETKTARRGTWWRWEVELKERWASFILDRLLRAAKPRAIMRSVVSDFYKRRVGVTLAKISRTEFHKLPQEVPSAARQLEWLALGVRPTVARLIEVYGRERVLHALGILPEERSSTLKLA